VQHQIQQAVAQQVALRHLQQHQGGYQVNPYAWN
jgi:hypothetical protein